MLDTGALLAPISEQAPAGADLSFSAEFDRILECRRADDPTLDQGAWQTDIKSADWNGVLRDCNTLLRTRTKDLRVAGWLSESATRLHGFAGLAAGFQLTAGLCDHYWDALHPLAHDGDQEERIGNLGWLLSNAQQWIRAVPIVVAPQGRFSLVDFEHAHSGSGDPSDGRPTLDTLEAARRDTPHDVYRQLADAIPNCVAALIALQSAVDARLGQDGPSFSAVAELLDHVQRTVLRFAREAGILLDGHTDAEEPAAAPGSIDQLAADAAQPALVRPSGTLATRREALQQLRQVADYFRRTEPHSPVAYLAEKAARWGEMPLHVWLRRVIKDHATLEQMEEMLDVNTETDGH